MISEKSILRWPLLHHRGASMHQKSQQGLQKNFESEFPVLSVLKLPSYGLVVFTDMNTYILTEGRDFKTFLKENYAVALENYYLFAKRVLIVKLNIILIVLIEFAYIKHS